MTPPAVADRTRLPLRPYQEEAIAEVVRRKAEGVDRQLGVAATGLGKTIIFGTLAADLASFDLDLPSTDVLILAHRDELIEQAVAKVRLQWPGVPAGIVKGQANNVRAPVVVASVQTLSRDRRLAQVAFPLRKFGLVIVDEAHHAPAATYRKILDAVGCGREAPPGWPADLARPLLFGVTATPDRADRVGLHTVFDEIAFTYDLLWGIEAGYLCDLRGVRVVLDFDLDKIKTTAGDYNEGQLGVELTKANAPRFAVEAYMERAAGRKGVAFWPTVALSVEAASIFRDAGIAAEHLDGETPTEERRAILRRLETGETQVVHNVGVLTEGFDSPGLEVVIMGRPTKSRGLYTQMAGRGTRKAPGKDDCLVIDLVGVSDAHDLVALPDLVGLPLKALRDGAVGVADAVDAHRAAEQQVAAHAQAITREVNLWEQKFRKAKLHWTQAAGAWILSAEGGFVALEETGDGLWRAVKKPRQGPFQTLVSDVDRETAMSAGEDHVRAYAIRSAIRKAKSEGLDQDAAIRRSAAIIRSDAPWRTRAPSQKAVSFARSKGIPVGDDWTAGQVSDAIDAAVAGQALRSRR